MTTVPTLTRRRPDIGGRAASDLARPRSLRPLRHVESRHVDRERTNLPRCRLRRFGHRRLNRGHSVVVLKPRIMSAVASHIGGASLGDNTNKAVVAVSSDEEEGEFPRA